ncbi:hypothetical protein MNBD_GAMMA23-40 [hydrothermal vent metagenome]|uniref:Flagellar FliJ protein n=1 Tax=hydrothermal vent metagenome TaxID=652676 RepID=A0A3B1AZI3_9ZZZZ
MKKSQRFSTLAELAKSKEQAAAIALGTSNRVYAENIEKLQSLKIYREEYLKRFTENGQQGMAVSAMQTYKSFINGLDQAIKDQQVKIAEAEQQCQASKKIWQHVHTKTKIMDTTVERFAQQERYHDERREQKEMDDRPHQSKIDIDH